jgi:hypothetical protein
VVGEVDDGAVEAVSNRRARRTSRRVLGAEHEVVDEQLRAPLEEVGERRAALVGLEPIVLLDAGPRQLLSSSRELVAAPRELFLGFEQLEPSCEPLVARAGRVVGHGCLLPDGTSRYEDKGLLTFTSNP